MISTESIWEEYHSRLLNFIRGRIPDPSEAEDILQDVFVRVHRHYATLKDVRKVESWIYRITRNVIVDHYRKSRTFEDLLEAGIQIPEQPDPEARQEILMSLMPLLNCLPEPYRQTLRLSLVEGLNQAALADRLGISVPGVKSRLQRGRARLRDLLLECCHFAFDRRGRLIDYTSRGPACPHC